MRKTERPYNPLGSAARKAQILALLADGPTSTAQMEAILGWPLGTIHPLVIQLYKAGKVRRESRRTAMTREFVYTLRTNPESYFATVLRPDSYAS